MHVYDFPKEAYFGKPERPFLVLGQVRSKQEFLSLDVGHDEMILCRNYFNQAVQDLVKRAKDNGADAVADVRSVTYLFDGRTETYSSPECSDDGAEGQVLVQGVAIKWKEVQSDIFTEDAQPGPFERVSPQSAEELISNSTLSSLSPNPRKNWKRGSDLQERREVKKPDKKTVTDKKPAPERKVHVPRPGEPAIPFDHN